MACSTTPPTKSTSDGGGGVIGGKRYDYRIPGAQYKQLMDSAPLSEEEKSILTRVRRGDSPGLIAYDMHMCDRTLRRRLQTIREVIARELV